MLTDIIRKAQQAEAKKGRDKLPTRDDFEELSTMFTAAYLGGGAHLDRDQCRKMSDLFATLGVSTIIVDD